MTPTNPPAIRGFVIDRQDGSPQLPGSLHTNRRLAQWLDLSQPGQVQVFIGKVELGQGILTALQLIVAEELDVPWSAVRMHSANTAHGPDEGVTSGSLSVQDSGGALRQACAEVRAMALQRAAEVSGHERGSISVREGVFYSAQGAELGHYASLLQGVDLDIECPLAAQPKAPQDRRLMGQAKPPRLDLADKVFGHARFIADLRLPGMLHGRVLRPPTMDATLAHWPAEVVTALGDGVQIWRDGRFVAVLAAQERQADAACAKLAAQLRWQAGSAMPEPHDLDGFLQRAPHHTTVTAERGQAVDDWPSDGLQHSAVYLKPYLAHASIGTSCAVALWDGQQLQVWSHSQGIHNLRDDLVKALAAEPTPVAKEQIVLRHVESAGCYGHNGADDVAFDAVLMALRCPGQPVRVLWSRADELTHGPFAAAHRVALRARVDEQGRISHWQHALWANGYSTRPGRAAAPALLAATQRELATAMPIPVNPPLAAGGGAERNAVPAYQVPNLQVLNHRLLVMPLRTSAMRALGAFANVFAIESFVDELASKCGQDPLAFRKQHLDDPRALAVLEKVTSQSSWWGQKEPEGVGQGLAWARYKNSGAWCAAIARVQVTEQVRVLQIDLAVDVGMVVDLDGVINQMEGGAVQATSWAIKEQVSFDAQGVTSNDWVTYPLLRFTEGPEVRVHVIDRPDQAPLGAGEAAHGPVVGALGNAVCQALGVRVRELPLSPDNLLRAVHAADAL